MLMMIYIVGLWISSVFYNSVQQISISFTMFNKSDKQKQECCELLKLPCSAWPPLAAPPDYPHAIPACFCPAISQEQLIGPCPNSYIFLVLAAHWGCVWCLIPYDRVGYNYAYCDIMGLDINILATREQGLFLFRVYHLAVVHPLLAERRTLFKPGVESELDQRFQSTSRQSFPPVWCWCWWQGSKDSSTGLHRPICTWCWAGKEK